MTEKTRVPDELVARLLLGELPADEAARVRAALEASPDGLARLEALEASNAEILRALPPPHVAAEVHHRLRERGLEPRRRRWVVPTLVAVAVALVVALLPGDRRNDDLVRLKGLAPALRPVPYVESPHPSPLSASRGFFGSRPFSRVNALLEGNTAADSGVKAPDDGHGH